MHTESSLQKRLQIARAWITLKEASDPGFRLHTGSPEGAVDCYGVWWIDSNNSHHLATWEQMINDIKAKGGD